MATLSVGSQVRQGAWLSVSDAGAMLGVSPSTVRNMVRAGELESRRSIGGHRRISRDSVCRWLGLDDGAENETERRTVVYARVSQNKQKLAGNLDRSVERLSDHCESAYGVTPIVISEVGSGLKEDRAGYLKLIDYVLSGKVDRVVVEHEDRIARYGVKVFRALCDRMGVELIVTASPDDEAEASPESEMTADILSLCTVYAARTHGRRGAEHKRMVITPEAAERIAALHRQAMTMSSIAEQLEVEGYRCPKTNKHYTPFMVRKALLQTSKLNRAFNAGPSAVDRFIADRLVKDDTARVFTKRLYPAYVAFAKANGESTPTARSLARALKDAGLTLVRTSSGYYYVKGYRLAE